MESVEKFLDRLITAISDMRILNIQVERLILEHDAAIRAVSVRTGRWRGVRDGLPSLWATTEQAHFGTPSKEAGNATVFD